MTRCLLLLCSVVLVSCSREDSVIRAGADFQKRLQEALINAKPGAVIVIGEGKHALDRTLSLAVANVTIKGRGMGQTILSFQNQKSGSAGVQVTASGFTLEDLAIEDTKGDALKINGATGVVIRRVRTEWTGGPKESNGAYGIYPVQCKDVLIEDSVAIGAADAGIYVGQSQNIIVRRNRAERNVAGIEIENSQFADVYENTATGNTGGLLVFNLPDLPVKGGHHTRVYDNRVIANNTPNFAPKGNLVAKVPAGTGVMVMATHHIEVFKNTISDNQTYNVSINSYLVTGNPINDAQYDPYTSAIYVHDNMIGGGGNQPDGRVARDIEPKVGRPIPSIIYDGILDPKLTKANGVPDDQRICIQNNGGATFANYDAGNGFKTVVRDAKAHDCSLAPLSPVTLTTLGSAGGA
ncbi:MAG TPA: parallel beta-helix domain-containing protein [Bryobacteraceae bacterium]|jgi:parallel beta-helix repeat protein|nr:parallel beta-helix domain-containing protein [Bryobacteraceae bacterium]